MAPKNSARSYARITKSLAKLESADMAYELEQDLKNGMTSDALRKKYQARLTARSILIAATSDDDAKAVMAIKDVTDRNEGRAMEKKSGTHHLEKLTDEQLEAMLRTEIDDLSSERKPADATLQ